MSLSAHDCIWVLCLGVCCSVAVLAQEEAGFYTSQYRHDDPYFHHKEMAEALLRRGDMAGGLKSFRAHMQFFNKTADVQEWTRLATFLLEQGTPKESLEAADNVQHMIDRFGSYHEEKWEREFLVAVESKFRGKKLEKIRDRVRAKFSRRIPRLRDSVSEEALRAPPPHGLPPADLVREVADVWDFVASRDFWDSFLERAPAVLRPRQPPAPALTVEAFAARGLRLAADGVFAKRGSFHADPPAEAKLQHGTVLDGEALARSWRFNLTTFCHGAQVHFPAVAALQARMERATALAANTMVYVSGPRQETGLEAHNDDKSVYVAQQQGSKRWRVWTRAAFFLPPTAAAVGRSVETELDPALLGEPDLDIVLRPGDVIYVPRGAVHCTSTADSPEQPSLSLTLTSLHSHYAWPFALGVFAGSTQLDDERPAQWLNHARFRRHWFDATRALAESRLDFRRIPPHDFWFGGGERWKEQARERLHAVVDELVDNTGFLESVRAAWHEERGRSPPPPPEPVVGGGAAAPRQPPLPEEL